MTTSAAVNRSFVLAVNIEAFLLGIFSIIYTVTIWALVWKSSRPITYSSTEKTHSPLSPTSPLGASPPSYKTQAPSPTRSFTPSAQPGFWTQLYNGMRPGNTNRRSLKVLAVLTMTAMYILTAAHWLVSMAHVYTAKELMHGPMIVSSLHVASCFLFCSVVILGDVYAIYRCYIVWQRWIMITLPIALLVGTSVMGYGACFRLIASIGSERFFAPRTEVWISTALSLALCTSVICTVLTASRIYIMQARLSSSRVSPPISHSIWMIVIHSGAICALTLLAILVAYAKQWSIGLVFGQMLPPLVGITFSTVSMSISPGFREILQDVESHGGAIALPPTPIDRSRFETWTTSPVSTQQPLAGTIRSKPKLQLKSMTSTDNHAFTPQRPQRLPSLLLTPTTDTSTSGTTMVSPQFQFSSLYDESELASPISSLFFSPPSPLPKILSPSTSRSSFLSRTASTCVGTSSTYSGSGSDFGYGGKTSRAVKKVKRLVKYASSPALYDDSKSFQSHYNAEEAIMCADGKRRRVELAFGAGRPVSTILDVNDEQEHDENLRRSNVYTTYVEDGSEMMNWENHTLRERDRQRMSEEVFRSTPTLPRSFLEV